MEQSEKIARATGLSEKAAKVYAALLALGEATIAEIAAGAKVKRTTIYSLLAELGDAGAIFETRDGKKSRWRAASPDELLLNAESRLREARGMASEADLARIVIPLAKSGRSATTSSSTMPRISFLSGPAGFKQVWNMLFKSKEREYRIVTDGSSFLDFVREQYILDEIIKKKQKLGIRSRQIILDTAYARKIIVKDGAENRVSRLLPREHGPLPFTEIIASHFVAFIAPRYGGPLFIVEDRAFAETRRTLFENLWAKLQ